MENSQQMEKLQELMQSQQQNTLSGGMGDLSSLKHSMGGKRKRGSKKHHKKGGYHSKSVLGGRKSRRHRKSSRKHKK